MTGFSFPFEIQLRAYIETNTAVQVLAPLDKQFVNSFMEEFNKIMMPIREHTITEVEGIEEVERHIEQNKQIDIAKKVKKPRVGENAKTLFLKTTWRCYSLRHYLAYALNWILT